MESIDKSTLWANRKCLLICSAVAIASMQYGIDTAAVGGLQAMPGFLMVFGYEDPTSPLGYGIDVKYPHHEPKSENILKCLIVYRPTTHDQPHELRRLHILNRRRLLRRILRPQARSLASLPRLLCSRSSPNWVYIACRPVRGSIISRFLEWLPRSLFNCVLQ
jgi:hypothetical protein